MQSQKFFDRILQNVSMFRMLEFFYFFFCCVQEDEYLSQMIRHFFYVSNAEQWNYSFLIALERSSYQLL